MRLTFAFVFALFMAQAAGPKLADGQLLIATRDLRDPNFAKTVVLIVHHGSGGTLGLVLNRQTDVPVSKALEELSEAKQNRDPVFHGGPVEETGVLALLRASAQPAGAQHIAGDVYLVANMDLLKSTLARKAGPNVFRVYAGSAGWGPGQLEGEMELGAWRIWNGDAATVFDADPDSLWDRMIHKTEEQIARVAEPLSLRPR